MPTSAPPSGGSFTSVVRDAEISTGDQADLWLRGLGGRLAGPATADLAVVATDATAVAAEAAGVAITGLIGVIVIIIALAAMLVFLLWGKYIRQAAREIPFVGVGLAHAVDWVINLLDSACHTIENAVMDAMRGVITAWLTIFRSTAVLVGLATLSQVGRSISHTLSPIATDIATLQRQGERLGSVIENLQAHVASEAHALWSRLTQLENMLVDYAKRVNWLLFTVGWIIDNLGQIWSWLHHILHQIGILITTVNWLVTEMSRVMHRIQRLENEVVRLTHRVAELEQLMPEVLAVGAVSLLLSPLLDAGPIGIENLMKLEEDPCHCFEIPGSSGQDLNTLVMTLWDVHEP